MIWKVKSNLLKLIYTFSFIAYNRYVFSNNFKKGKLLIKHVTKTTTVHDVSTYVLNIYLNYRKKSVPLFALLFCIIKSYLHFSSKMSFYNFSWHDLICSNHSNRSGDISFYQSKYLTSWPDHHHLQLWWSHLLGVPFQIHLSRIQRWINCQRWNHWSLQRTYFHVASEK